MKLRVKKTGNGDFTGAMTDISFLLIIFFLVTSVFMATQGILLRLPDESSEPRRLKPGEVIRINILSSNQFLFGDEEVAQADLGPLIARRVSLLEDPVLILGVEKDVIYQDVLKVLETAREKGVSAFSISSVAGAVRGVKIEGDKE